MLSKSSARWFFIGGTTVFSLVFLGLTLDTVSQVPKRSNQEQMSEAVIHGHDIWTDNNCMGCHTLLGEGAYYAPELTKVVERRGKPWMRLFLKDPQAMFPGQRKMVQYNFSDEEIEDVITFFEWIGNIDTNGFPAKPDLAPPPPPVSTATQTALTQKPMMFATVCSACHATGGEGGTVGPALDGVSTRFSTEQLHSWLKDPQAYKPGTAMPNLNLSDDTIQELVTFLNTL